MNNHHREILCSCMIKYTHREVCFAILVIRVRRIVFSPFLSETFETWQIYVDNYTKGNLER